MPISAPELDLFVHAWQMDDRGYLLVDLDSARRGQRAAKNKQRAAARGPCFRAFPRSLDGVTPGKHKYHYKPLSKPQSAASGDSKGQGRAVKGGETRPVAGPTPLLAAPPFSTHRGTRRRCTRPLSPWRSPVTLPDPSSASSWS